MRFVLTTICFLNSLLGFSQVDLFFPLTPEIDWASVEKQNPELKTKFIKNLPEDLEYYTQVQMFSIADLEDGLHILDFNGDGLDDIIFTGWSGFEGNAVMIFINTGHSFTKIFTEYQNIHKIVFLDGKIHKIHIQEGGFSEDCTVAKKIYSIDYSTELPTFNLVSQMQFVDYLSQEYPSNYFDKPIKFAVLNDKYNLRYSPVIDNTEGDGFCGEPRTGNILGKIKAGSIGYALAEKEDSTGRIWWFAALHPNSEIEESVYYDFSYYAGFSRSNSYKLGWISSRFVKEIDF